MRTIRIQYKDDQGRRCTTFLETYGELTVEDVTDQVKQWRKVKVRKPSKADLALAKIVEILKR